MPEHHQDPNAALVAACRKGEQGAMKQLYELYVKAMFNTACRILRDEAEARDVVQEAFIDAFNGIAKFSGTATFGAWLKRIVVNKSIDQLKKNKISMVSLNGVDYKTAEASTHDHEPQYTVEMVRKAMDELPDGYRIVLSLYLFEGYDHSEIAGILGISESGSKSQYSRAKSKIREMLKEKNYV